MFIYGDTAQFTVCLNSKVVKVLKQIAKEGGFIDVSSLVESMLFEIALDEGLTLETQEFDKLKSNGKHRASL